MKLPRFQDYAAEFNNEIWGEAAKSICRKHGITFEKLSRAATGDNIIIFVDEKCVIKIYVPTRNGRDREISALETARTSLKIPEIIAYGEFEDYKYLIMTRIRGVEMNRENWLKLEKSEQNAILTELAEGLRELHLSDCSKIDFEWNKFIQNQAKTCFERQKFCHVNERVLAQIPAYLEENLPLLPVDPEKVFLHGDVHFGNLRFRENGGKWKISGLFDFADSLKGFREYEILAVGVLMIQGQGELQREFFRAFGYADSEINEELRKRLMLLTMFYECSDLRRYALRLRAEAVDYSLPELERAIWNF